MTMMAAFGELVSLCLQGNTRENLRTPGCLICFWEIHTYSAAQVKGHFFSLCVHDWPENFDEAGCWCKFSWVQFPS